MGNLATACAGSRSQYRMNGGAKPTPLPTPQQGSAQRSQSMLTRMRSFGRRRQERPSNASEEVGNPVNPDVAAKENESTAAPAAKTATGVAEAAAAASDQPRDPVLEQLIQLNARLQNFDQLAATDEPVPTSPHRPAAEPATPDVVPQRPATRRGKYIRCLSYSGLPCRLNSMVSPTSPTADKPADASDNEVAFILELALAPPPSLASALPPPKLPKRRRGCEAAVSRHSAPTTPPQLRKCSDARTTPPPKPPKPKISNNSSERFAADQWLPVAMDNRGSLVERRARANSPDSLDGSVGNGPSRNLVQELGQPPEQLPKLEEDARRPKLRNKQQSLQKKNSARPTSKSVFNLADPAALMDASAYENFNVDSPLGVIRPTCFGSAMCHMDHLAASRDLLNAASTEAATAATTADAGELALPLLSRSRAARQILSRPFVQCLPVGGESSEFLRVCRSRGCLTESAMRELLRTNGGATARAEKFVQLFDWSETSLRKLAQCLTATAGQARFYVGLAGLVNFLADLFALLAARHLFAQPDSRAGGKRRRAEAFLRGVRLIDGEFGRDEDQELRCQIQLLYLSNTDQEEPASGDAPNMIDSSRQQQLTAGEVAAINEPGWISANFTPGLSIDLAGSGVNAWFFKQLVGRSLEPVVELSLAGCDLDSGLLPTLVLTQRTSRLRVLCLAGASLGDESLSALCLLPRHQLASLEVLDLSACGVSHFGLSLLVNCLQVTLPSLSDLDLSWNDLSEATPATVAGLLDPAAGLRGLRLRGCRLTSDALRAVVDGLSGADRLRRLDLSDNRLNCLILSCLAERLGHGARSFGDAGLTELALAGTNLFATDLQKLLDSGGCDGCRRLDLGRNHLGEAGAVALANRLPARLECLAVNSCRIGCRGLRQLLEAVKLSPRVRLVRAANNLRARRGGLGAEETSLRRDIAGAAAATGGRLNFLIEDAAAAATAADADVGVSEGARWRLARRTATAVGTGVGGGGLRRSLRRLASLD